MSTDRSWACPVQRPTPIGQATRRSGISFANISPSVSQEEWYTLCTNCSCPCCAQHKRILHPRGSKPRNVIVGLPSIVLKYPNQSLNHAKYYVHPSPLHLPPSVQPLRVNENKCIEAILCKFTIIIIGEEEQILVLSDFMYSWSLMDLHIQMGICLCLSLCSLC